MTDSSAPISSPNQDEHYSPHRVRLPGFVIDEEIGLGDVIKQATSYLGIKPCGGCAKRAAMLNRWVVFTDQNQK